MSILVKAALGLFAGVVAGGLGLAFVPRVAPNALQPRHAVEKPQFVAAAASREAPRAAAVAVAAVATPAPDKPAAAPATSVVGPAKPVVVASPLKTAERAPPKPAPIATSVAPIATSVAVASPAPTPSALAAHASAPPNEVAARWSVQGLEALAKGDLASARQFLTRAAEAGDPRAWVALADTYDPAMLSKLGVVGAPGDAQRAHDYLVKAAAAGLVIAKELMVAADQN